MFIESKEGTMIFKDYDELIQYKKVYIEMMARDGVTNKDIAKKLGIPYDEFETLAKTNKTLQTLLTIGREETDYEVENALYRLATGYSYTEVKKEVVNRPIVKDGVVKGKTVTVTTKTNKKVIPPDINAIRRWQDNRQKGKWDRELTAKTNINITGGAPVQIIDDVPELPPEITGKE